MEECKYCGLKVDNGTKICDKCSKEYHILKLDRPYYMGKHNGVDVWSHYDSTFHYDLNKLK
jgi:hypothetical protein